MRTRILACVCLCLTASLPGQTLIHYYDFSSGVTDLAGTDNGTLTNGAAVSGGKLVLDGTNDYVSFATKLVPTSGAFSVAFFAQTPLSTGANAEIISQGSSGAPGFYVGYIAPANTVRLGDQLTSTGIAFPSDGLNHHYALTMDTTNTRFYIDGSLAGTFGAITVAGTDNTLFGAQYQSFGEFFGGTIDEMRIYTGALSGPQVAALSAIPEPAAAAGLLGGVALAIAHVAQRRRETSLRLSA